MDSLSLTPLCFYCCCGIGFPEGGLRRQALWLQVKVEGSEGYMMACRSHDGSSGRGSPEVCCCIFIHDGGDVMLVIHEGMKVDEDSDLEGHMKVVRRVPEKLCQHGR